MNDNYYVNQETTNGINNINYLYSQEKKSLGSNTITNSSSQEGNKTIENTDDSFGIEEVPPKEEDIDHLRIFNMENKVNNVKKIPYPYTNSFQGKNNRPISGRIPHPRRTQGFIQYNKNLLELGFNPNKRNASGEKPPVKQVQSKYSSASENKYHFIKRLAGNPIFGIPIFTENNIPKMNNGPFDTKTLRNPSDNHKMVNNAHRIYPYNRNTNYNVINRIHSNSNQKNIMNGNNNLNNKTTSNYSYNTVNTTRLQNNIQLVRIEPNKNNQIQNKVINNKIVQNYPMPSQDDDDIMEYYPMDNQNALNNVAQNYQNKFKKNDNIGNAQRLTVGYKYPNDVSPIYGKKAPEQTQVPNKKMNLNQTKKTNNQKKNPKIATVTKISSTSMKNNKINQVNNPPFNPTKKINPNGVNNPPLNPAKNVNPNRVNNPPFNPAKNINPNVVNNQYFNQMLNPYISPAASTIIPTTQINNPLDNNYRPITNNFNEQNINLLINQNNYNYNYNNVYNKSESERATVTNNKINDIEIVNVEDKNDMDLLYNDFDCSGYVKNYGGVTHPGKDSSGNTKTNQDSFVCKTNINNIKDFNIFGVLDGHGPDGHFVSEFVSELIPSKIIEHPEIKQLSDPELIYKKLKENNYKIIHQAFKETDNMLKNVEFNTQDSGTTCCLILHTGKHIICANTGDSRAVVGYDISNNSNPKNLDYLSGNPLSIDYKPELPEETNRILMAGGVVEQLKDEYGEGVGPFRVWIRGKDYPGLAMSRSLGDLKGKTIGVIPDPGIMEYNINKSTKYIVACSDGVWEFLNNETVLNIGKKFYIENNASSFCHELISKSIIEWEKNDKIVDDITAVVAFF